MPWRRALFLDKDGVINVDHGYVCTPERTDFIGGIFDLCRTATRHGWLVIVVTNQAGIARGHYSEQTFLAYMDWVCGVFVQHGARLDAVYHCPHHPVHGTGEYLRDCECRKPKPGMVLAAQRDWDIDLARSLLLGDSASDLEAGAAAGVGTSTLVRTDVEEGSGRLILDAGFVQGMRDFLSAGRDSNVRLPSESDEHSA